MPHQILKRLWVHARLRHVATIHMETDIGRNIRHLHPANLIVTLGHMIETMFPVHRHQMGTVFIRKKKSFCHRGTKVPSLTLCHHGTRLLNILCATMAQGFPSMLSATVAQGFHIHFMPPWHKETTIFSTHSHLPSRSPKGYTRSFLSPPSYNSPENNPEFSLPKS